MLYEFATALSYLSLGAMMVIYYQFISKIEPFCFWLPGGLGKYYRVHKTITTSFDDIVGLTDIKKEIKGHLDLFKEKQQLSKGFLFTGPSGTGKTLMARAIAGESNLPFIEIFVKDCAYGHVPAVINTVLKKYRPCIIFIDECNAIVEHNSETFLRKLDGITNVDDVILILATNSNVTPALRRSGRIDKVINFMLPSENDRYNMFIKMGFSHDKAAELKRQTHNFSYADIAIIPRELKFVKRIYNKTDDQALERVLDKLTLGRHTTECRPEDKTKERLAYHEIGHLVTAYALKDFDKPRKITIIPGGFYAGTTLMNKTEKLALTKTDIMKFIAVYLASSVFEEYYMGEYSTFCSHDFNEICGLIETMENNHMFGYRLLTNTEKNNPDRKFDDRTSFIITALKPAINNIIENHSDVITVLHKELLARETLNYDEFASILGNDLLNSLDL